MSPVVKDPRGFNALYDAMTQAWRQDRYADAWNRADLLLNVDANEGPVRLAAPRDITYVRAIHTAYAPPPLPAGAVAGLLCCGNWIPCPAQDSVSLCPGCKSVFTLAMAMPAEPDAGYWDCSGWQPSQ